MNETTRTITEADAEAVAEKVNQKLFESFGFDISTPKGRIEAAGAMRWLMICYRAMGIVWRVGVTGGVSAAVLWVIWKTTGWAGPPK